MSKRIRSAKGELVDFDILTIKSQIASGQLLKAAEPTKIDVKRQDSFITKKVKRTISKTTTNNISEETTSKDTK